MTQGAQAIVLTDAEDKPLESADKECPGCGAGPDRRRPSGGFGALHDVCGECGHDFEEYTCG